ncbi:hypothetical protein [Rhodobacteraceae bacterium DSL-40]|uniref:hypothetical protein n=1 Tax=Amaricoccus sp. B4 TaxID=3368557 RepID=UPI0013A6C959
MYLSDRMTAELEERLAQKSRELAEDPAYRPLPAADWAALAAIFAVSLVALALVGL